MVVHVDDVPVISADSHGQEAETEQTSEPSRQDHPSIHHPVDTFWGPVKFLNPRFASNLQNARCVKSLLPQPSRSNVLFVSLQKSEL